MFLSSGGLCPPPSPFVQQYGGAIGNYGGDVTFKAGSLFDGNIASSTGDGGSGGAVYNYDGGVMT